MPTWKILTLFFCLMFLGYLITGSEKFVFSLKDIISSYFFIKGIGFVWIIMVFLVISFANPLLLKISKKIQNTKIYFFIYLMIYFVYLGLTELDFLFEGKALTLYNNIFLYNIGYMVMAAIGIRLKLLTQKQLRLMVAAFFMVFVF